MIIRTSVLLLVLLAGCGEPMTRGEAKYRVCAGCHEGGIGPHLKGRDVADSLRSFRDGEGNPLMQSQASNLSDQDISDISEYLLTY